MRCGTAPCGEGGYERRLVLNSVRCTRFQSFPVQSAFRSTPTVCTVRIFGGGLIILRVHIGWPMGAMLTHNPFSRLKCCEADSLLYRSVNRPGTWYWLQLLLLFSDAFIRELRSGTDCTSSQLKIYTSHKNNLHCKYTHNMPRKRGKEKPAARV